jgi:hypothetical protein
MSTQDIEQKKPGGNFRWEFVPGNLSVSTIVRAVIVVALVMFAVTTPGFLTMPSIRSLLSTMSFMGCVAVGMTFITLSGNHHVVQPGRQSFGDVDCLRRPAAARRRRCAGGGRGFQRGPERRTGITDRLLSRQSDHCHHGGLRAGSRGLSPI